MESLLLALSVGFGIYAIIGAVYYTAKANKEDREWEKGAAERFNKSFGFNEKDIGFTPKDEGYVERPYGYTPNPFVNAEIARKMFLPDEEEERD